MPTRATPLKVGDIICFLSTDGSILRGAGVRKVTRVRDDGYLQLDNAIYAHGFGHEIRWTKDDPSYIAIADPADWPHLSGGNHAD